MQTSTTALPLIGVLIPKTGVLRDAMLVFGFSLFIALSAYVSIPLPFTPVPITGQTLAVLLTGATLGSRLGSLAMLAYLAEGLAGLPVFAGGASAWTLGRTGLPVIIGPSAGYLFSYPLAAFAVGYLAERGWDRSVWRAATAMLLGEAIIYAIGLPWLAMYVGPMAAIPLGLLPFIPGDTIKLFLAATALPGAWTLVGRGKSSESSGGSHL